MSLLPQFLQQIGAAELPSTVKLPTQEDKTGPIGKLLERIQQEITSVNDQTRALLLEEWPQFTDQVQTGQLLLSELAQEEKELLELEGFVEGEKAILPPLVSALQEHASLSTAHANSSTTLALLTTLIDLHTRIQTTADQTTAGSLPEAVSSLTSLLAYQANDAPERWISSTDSWRSLERWAIEERARLETALVSAVESCFEVTLPKEEQEVGQEKSEEPLATLRLRKSVACAPGATPLSLTALLTALGQVYELPAAESIKSKGRSVEHHLANVAKQLLKHFVAPFLAAAGSASSANSLQALSFGYASSPDNADEQLVSLLPLEPHHPPLTILSKLLSFFAAHSSLIPSSWAPSFTKHFTPPLQTLLIDTFLSPSLPTQISSLPPYLALLVAASGFEGEFLPQGGWFAFLPPTATGTAAPEEATVIKSWMARVDKHWAKRVGDSALARVRQVVQANDWKGEEVETEVIDIIQAPPPPPPARDPTPPPPVFVEPPKPKMASPIAKARPFSPITQTPQLAAPSPAPTPAPRPGKLGTRIGGVSPIPVKPKTTTAKQPIPVKVRAAAPPPTTLAPANAKHNTRESVAQLAGAGLVSAGIAQVIARAEPPGRAPVPAASSAQPPPPPPQVKSPPLPTSPPLPVAAVMRSPSMGSSSPARVRSPTMPRRGSIVSHAPVTKVEPSETDEPDWELAGSPVIDPVTELGWGSGAGFFDMLGSGTLDPVAETAEVKQETQQQPQDTAADLESGGDGWDLDEPAQEEPVQQEPVEEKAASPPPPTASQSSPTFTSLPPLTIPSSAKQPEPTNAYDPPAQQSNVPQAASQPTVDLSSDELLPTTRSRAASELEPAGAELTSPTAPLAKSVSALVPENAAELVNGAVAAGLGVVGSAASLFRSTEAQGGDEEDLEAGQGDEEQGWGIEEEGEIDEEQGWPGGAEQERLPAQEAPVEEPTARYAEPEPESLVEPQPEPEVVEQYQAPVDEPRPTEIFIPVIPESDSPQIPEHSFKYDEEAGAPTEPAEDDPWALEEGAAEPVAEQEEPAPAAVEEAADDQPSEQAEPTYVAPVKVRELLDSPPLVPRENSPSPVRIDDGLTPIDYSAELAALSPSPSTSSRHRYPWQRDSMSFAAQAAPAPQPRMRSLSLTEEALVTPPNEPALSVVTEGEDWPREPLPTAHDYLSPTAIDEHTPQPSATPEEFIIPGDLEDGVPSKVFVPEAVDERLSYDYTANANAYDYPQHAAAETNGWDVEAGAPAEEQRPDEPEFDAEREVELEASYEPTSAYEPQPEQTYDEESGPAGDDSWEIEDGQEEQPQVEYAEGVLPLEAVVTEDVPQAEEVIEAPQVAEAEPELAVEEPVEAQTEEPIQETAPADDGWDLEEHAEEPVEVEQAEEVHALEDTFVPETHHPEPEVEVQIEQPAYVSPAAPTAVEVNSAEEEDDGWDLEEQTPAAEASYEYTSEEPAAEPADFAPVIPGYEEQEEHPEPAPIEPAPGSLSVAELAVEGGSGWGIEQEEEAHEPEIEPEQLAQHTIEAGFPAPEVAVQEQYAAPEPEPESKAQYEVEPEAEEDGWGIEGEGEYDEESGPYEPYQPPPPVQQSAPAPANSLNSFAPEDDPYHPSNYAPAAQQSASDDLNSFEPEEDANGAADGWGLGDDEVDEEAAYDYAPPAQVVSPPPKASAPSSANKAPLARTPGWPQAGGSPVVHPPTPRESNSVVNSPTPAARPPPPKQSVVAPPPRAVQQPAFVSPVAKTNLSVPQHARAASFGSEGSGNSGESGEDAWGLDEDLELDVGFDDEPQQAAPAQVYSPPPPVSSPPAPHSLSSSYTFSPPSSSHAFDPPPLEEEAVDDGWGFELEDDGGADDGEGEAMRLRGGAYGAEEEPDEPDWGMKSPPTVHPGQKIRRRKEPMMISAASKQLIQIAEEVLTDALAVGDPAFQHPTFANASEPLFQTFLSLFALYRATAPVQHATLLESVPALGMQFANDALWMAEELERMWDRLGKGKAGKDEQGKTARVTDAVKRMKKMGTEWRAKQVDIQRAVLMESLDEAKGFLYMADEQRYATAERALQQVIHSLHRLANVWKSVLNQAVLHHALGGLINDVLVRVLNEIEDQQDISEEESIRLNKLCKMLHELESLFEGTATSIGREVPTYFKFVFLSELLEASMADVLFLFDNGHLVDFAPREIAKLVRALFSDSPLRAKNLDHIMLGHPEVPLDGGEEGGEGQEHGRW